jgi:membrane associated rhomboid family serine protease
MAYSITDEQDVPRITPAVQWLIGLNVLIYFLQLTVVPPEAMWGALGFELRDLDSWWTVFTYMFVHGGFWHLALNMYMLWIFGPRLEHSWTPGRFTMFYLWCGLGGWLFHLLFARNAPIIGASAATLGVMLAYAMRWPDDEVLAFWIVPMKVKWLVALLVGINLINGAASLTAPGSGVAYFAHLGGLAFAWLWMRTPSAQSLDRLRQRVSQVPDIPDETPRAIPRSLPRSRERTNEVDEVVAKSKAIVAKRPAPPTVATNAPRDERSAKLDMVLDKISQKGLASLTHDERRLLEEMSKELRKK